MRAWYHESPMYLLGQLGWLCINLVRCMGRYGGATLLFWISSSTLDLSEVVYLLTAMLWWYHFAFSVDTNEC